MKQLKQKTYEMIKMELDYKINNTPLNMGENDIKSSVQAALRKLNEVVFSSRALAVSNPGVEFDISELDIDEVLIVYFSQDNQIPNGILPEAGLLPLLLGSGSRTLNIEAGADYLAMKSSLNSLLRQMKISPDYEMYSFPDRKYIRFNQNYSFVVINYLPYIDPEAEGDTWKLYENEYQFVLELAWAEINLRSAESLYAAGALGVYGESEKLVNYYAKKKVDIVKEFTDSGACAYVG